MIDRALIGILSNFLALDAIRRTFPEMYVCSLMHVEQFKPTCLINLIFSISSERFIVHINTSIQIGMSLTIYVIFAIGFNLEFLFLFLLVSLIQD